jgi:acyl-coenzyme A synthetase/AMP-(fatty) acid ligase
MIGNISVKELDTELESVKIFSNNPTTLADDPAYLVYTSGTTGYPKGVLHAHRALLGREPASKYWFNFSDSKDRILHTGKFNWTYALGSALMDPLYHGKTVIVYEGKNDPSVWLNLIKKHKATIFVGVPSIYRQILQKTQGVKKDVATLKHCMSAGEHLSDEIFDQWTARFDLNIYEAVGMSEFSYYISQSIYSPIRPGSAGFPQPGHNIQLLDIDTLKPVKTGDEGMICIPNDDPGLFIKYWNLEKETEKHKHSGWFFTGDYARYDRDGYLWFLGRKDDIIKSFGYRVSPYEIERIFKSHPEVSDCAAIGEAVGQDKILVVVYLILNENSQINPNDLILYGRKNLATYKSPKIAYIVNSLPRTKNGKILRKEINKSIALRQSDIR